MSAWKPTDEQVDVIAGERFREALGGDATWAIQSPAVKARFEKRVRAEIETSYIQSIIRAAQAEAWERGQATGRSRAMRNMSDESGLSLHADNPFKDAS